MSGISKPRIRIMASIERRKVPKPLRLRIKGQPKDIYFVEVLMDLVVTIDGKDYWSFIGDFSDDQIHKKFDHAAYAVLKDYGLEMELLPEEKWEQLPEVEGIERVLVSKNVTEFEANSKSAQEIEAETAALREAKAVLYSLYAELIDEEGPN